MFQLIHYSDNFEGKMNTIKTRWSTNDVKSVHTTGSNGQNCSVYLWNLFRSFLGYGSFTGAIAYGSNFGYAERTNKSTGETCLAICKVDKTAKSISFNAAVMDANGTIREYENTRKGSVLTAAYIAASYSSDGELQAVMNDLEEYASYESDADEWDDPLICVEFGRKLCLLSQNVYYSVKEVNKNSLEVTVNKLRQADIKKLSSSIDMVIYGTLQKVSMTVKSQKVISMGDYMIDASRTLSAMEKTLIPKIPESYVWPDWVISICKEIKESSIFMEPTRNVLLSGPAGTGKTTGAMGIAYLLGLPYVKITCSPDTDMFDIIGQMLPNTEKEDVNTLFEKLGIPTFEDVANDPAGTFEVLFGRKMDKYDSESDCYVEIFNRVRESMEKTKDFVYVKSNFIRGIQNGWVVEIQEPNVIKKKSVLVGLNGIMENNSNSATITLPTGETINRHRDAVIVITTNGDYDGCTTLQQSVLSRVQSVYQIEAPEESVLAERAMKATGFTGKAMITKMAKFILECAGYCKDHDITDGVCGPRELQNWAKKAILLQKEEDGSAEIGESAVIYAAFPTVISKASQNADEQEEILTAVFQKLFSQNEVQEAKDAYMAGKI